MNKKILKTFVSVTCILGIASTIPCFSTSCNKNEEKITFNNIEEFKKIDFSSWTDNIGIIKNKDYAYGKPSESQPVGYYANLEHDLSLNNKNFQNLIWLETIGTFEYSMCSLILGSSIEDETLDYETINEYLSPKYISKFHLSISSVDNIQWFKCIDGQLSVAFSCKMSIDFSLTKNCYFVGDVSASIEFSDLFPFLFTNFWIDTSSRYDFWQGADSIITKMESESAPFALAHLKRFGIADEEKIDEDQYMPTTELQFVSPINSSTQFITKDLLLKVVSC